MRWGSRIISTTGMMADQSRHLDSCVPPVGKEKQYRMLCPFYSAQCVRNTIR